MKHLLPVCFVLLLAGLAQAEGMPNHERGTFEDLPEGGQEWQFEAPPGTQPLGVMMILQLEAGDANLTMTAPDGSELISESWASVTTVYLKKLESIPGAGATTLRLHGTGAQGNYQVSVFPVPGRGAFIRQVAGGVGMVTVGVLAIIAWAIWRRPPWRWFAVGALIWVLGVTIKVADAFLLMMPLFKWMEATFSFEVYVALASVWGGIESALCEIGVTLLAVLFFRQMARDGNRAVAVGAGAGGLEAILIGIAGAAGAVAAIAGIAEAQVAVGDAMLNTPLLFLVGTVERILAISLHIGSRCLVIYGVAARRWMPVLSGFLLFSVIDGIATGAHVSGSVSHMNMWWLEVAIAPVAVLCIFATRWCLRRWPAPPPPPEQTLTAPAAIAENPLA